MMREEGIGWKSREAHGPEFRDYLGHSKGFPLTRFWIPPMA